MLTTIEAEVEIGGVVRLLEPLEVTRPTRAIVTLLERNGSGTRSANARRALDFLSANRLSDDGRPHLDEINAHIREARESWD